ncbi:addiction module antidote protein [Acidipropionibacterium acidipropionici]|jgi:probable addiction module antidote protein|uniref:addiction module antidote protein n=1 Tax=Acidipropionibacterium acidipropionici TaxID=1748 RepID=UPI000423AEFD|nr:addiction module antidote protein [Acidipropionibacterium acidipropionici]ALN14629.1 addiction module antitoxin [Acidipropionibacterium acidipropionici]APZ09614.1 transcriptional regulator [Acidipropionibacterium acidipropionici]
MSNETYDLFDAADYITTDDDAALLLQTALEDSSSDPSALPTALGIIARSGNMSELARRAGMSRDGLYRALSETGNPTWTTIVKVLTALDLRLEVHRVPAA